MCMQGVSYEQLPVTIAPEFKALYNSATHVWHEVWEGPLLTCMGEPALAVNGRFGNLYLLCRQHE